MWRGDKVSIILPTFRECNSIRAVIEDFFSTGVVDEIIVVNNNAEQGTSEAVAATRAREIFEPRQGPGFALRTGLEAATGEILIPAEPDGTCVGRDVLKLLAYADDFDVVLASRTTTVMIWSGSDMFWLRRISNYLMAKIITWLYNTTFLSDPGNWMRLMRRGAWESIAPRLRRGDALTNLEMTLWTIRCRCRFIEIPLNYRPRVGLSGVIVGGSSYIRYAIMMFALIIRHRWESLVRG